VQVVCVSALLDKVEYCRRRLLYEFCGASGAFSLEMPGHYGPLGYSELHPERHPKLIHIRMATTNTDESGNLAEAYTWRDGILAARLLFVDEAGTSKPFLCRQGKSVRRLVCSSVLCMLQQFNILVFTAAIARRSHAKF
jgi:hypothetical protein